MNPKLRGRVIDLETRLNIAREKNGQLSLKCEALQARLTAAECIEMPVGFDAQLRHEREKFQAETRRTALLSDLLRDCVVNHFHVATTHHGECEACAWDLRDFLDTIEHRTANEGFGLGWVATV